MILLWKTLFQTIAVFINSLQKGKWLTLCPSWLSCEFKLDVFWFSLQKCKPWKLASQCKYIPFFTQLLNILYFLLYVYLHLKCPLLHDTSSFYCLLLLFTVAGFGWKQLYICQHCMNLTQMTTCCFVFQCEMEQVTFQRCSRKFWGFVSEQLEFDFLKSNGYSICHRTRIQIKKRYSIVIQWFITTNNYVDLRFGYDYNTQGWIQEFFERGGGVYTLINNFSRHGRGR